MPAHISLITLGVADVAKATAFYERLGFVRSKTASQESVSFFQAGPLVLALWGRDAQRDDAEAAAYGLAMAASSWRRMLRARMRSM